MLPIIFLLAGSFTVGLAIGGQLKQLKEGNKLAPLFLIITVASWFLNIWAYLKLMGF